MFVLSAISFLIVASVFSVGTILAVINFPLQNFPLVQVMGGMLGFLTASVLSGKFVVLIHELKHKLLIGIVGAKTKSLEVHDNESGSIEFEYTTAVKNFIPFIALAPYFLPILTLLTTPFWTIFWGTTTGLKRTIFAYVAMFDICFNMRELHPNQSDLEIVPGGRTIALIFIYSFNLTFFNILLLMILDGPGLILKSLNNSINLIITLFYVF